MNEQDYNELREAAWRRPLTPAEQVELNHYLAAHPAAAETWELDGALSALLDKLPDAPPVSSNFTARVLQAVARETAASQRATPLPWWSRFGRWVPRAATALVVVGSMLFIHQQHEAAQRAELARNVAELTQAVSGSGPELIKDFEPIRQLGDEQAKPDTELLVLLK